MRHTSFLEVNLNLLSENYDLIKRLGHEAEVIPMVKADAYGNGMVKIAHFLINECGAKNLGCASLGEALFLKEKLPDLDARVFVFSDTELHSDLAMENYERMNIVPVLHRAVDLELVLTDPIFSKLPLIIKINTGMNRLGVILEDLEKYIPLLKSRGIEHLMTHFARSSELIQSGDKTNRQYEEFLKIKKFLIDSGVSVKETSVSNSGAIEQQFGVNETHIRPGIMLYGPPSVLTPILWKGNQISRWVTKIISSFHAKKGTPIGYGVNVADKDSFFAVIPLGYGDGFLTYYSGLKLLVNGVQGKIFGRVNMDMAFIQFDSSASENIKNNDIVEIWNNDHRTIIDIALQAKTHAYQVMCAVSNRIPKIYKVT